MSYYSRHDKKSYKPKENLFNQRKKEQDSQSLYWVFQVPIWEGQEQFNEPVSKCQKCTKNLVWFAVIFWIFLKGPLIWQISVPYNATNICYCVQAFAADPEAETETGRRTSAGMPFSAGSTESSYSRRRSTIFSSSDSFRNVYHRIVIL